MRTRYWVAVTILPLVVFTQGCTGIGYLVGREADAKLPDSVVVPRSAIGGLKAGEKITVVSRNAKTLDGKFTSMGHDTLVNYQRRLREFCTRSSSVGLSGPLDTVSVAWCGRKTEPMILQAYDYNEVILSTTGGSLLKCPYDSIESFQTPTRLLTGPELYDCVTSSFVPLRSSLIIERCEMPARTTVIPMADVDCVRCENVKQWAIIGTLAGLTADVIVVAAIAQGMRHMFSFSGMRL